MCRTFILFPLAFLDGGRGDGLGFANQPVRFSGETGESGHRPRKFWQSIYVFNRRSGELDFRHAEM